MTETENQPVVVIAPEKSAKAQFLEKYQVRFEPGKSGNPGGRPKSRAITTAARNKMDEIDPKTGKTFAEGIVDAQVKKALSGDTWAARLLQEWTEGKLSVSFSAEINGDSEAAISSAKQKLLQRFIGYRELPDANQGEHSETQRS